jgi:hypothetical protein
MYGKTRRWRRVAAAIGVAVLLFVFLGPILLPDVVAWLIATALAGLMAFVVMTKFALAYEHEGVALEGGELQARITAAVQTVNANARVARRKPNGCVIQSNNSPRYRLVFRWEKAAADGYDVIGRSEPPGFGEFADRLLRARIAEWVKICRELDSNLGSYNQ